MNKKKLIELRCKAWGITEDEYYCNQCSDFSLEDMARAYRRGKNKGARDKAIQNVGFYQKQMQDIYDKKNKQIADLKTQIEKMKWHKVSDGDLPKDRHNVYVVYMNGYYQLEKTIASFRHKYWIINGLKTECEIIAWCELPKWEIKEKMTKDEYKDFALRYKGCGACFPMYHTLSRFEKMWFSAIQKDVAELEKENAELKADNDARKFAMAMSEKVEKQLREENAKLKEKLKPENCLKLLAKEGYIKFTSDQLTKAKEIIKKFSEFVNNEVEYDPEHPQEHTDLWNKLCEEAEQFLKDCEVEK